MEENKSNNSEDLDSQGSQREPAAMRRGQEFTEKDIMTAYFAGPVTFNGPVTYVCESKEATKLLERDLKSATDHHQVKVEELCHFVHPAVDSSTEWLIHEEIKRLVERHRMQEICAYLLQMKKEKKVLLPQSPSAAYEELVRMGMPQGEGFTEVTFRKYYNN